jgi:hypothetical protein
MSSTDTLDIQDLASTSFNKTDATINDTIPNTLEAAAGRK